MRTMPSRRTVRVPRAGSYGLHRTESEPFRPKTENAEHAQRAAPSGVDEAAVQRLGHLLVDHRGPNPVLEELGVVCLRCLVHWRNDR